MKRWLDPSDTQSRSKRHLSSPTTVEFDHEEASEHQVNDNAWRSSPTSPTIIPCDRPRDATSSDESNTNELLCFGSLTDLPVQVREEPPIKAGQSTARERRTDFVAIRPVLKGGFFWLLKERDEPFGCLSGGTSVILKRLLTYPSVNFECVVRESSLEKSRSQWKKFGRTTKMLVDLNIYGNKHSAQSVGGVLAAARLFLQPPLFDYKSLPYDNPQYLKLPNVTNINMVNAVAETIKDPNQEGPKNASVLEIEALLDHIPQPQFLSEAFADNRIRTPLDKHQSEAVDFITKRETTGLHPSLTLWKPYVSETGFFCYKHIITGAKSSEIEDVKGGILADDMGLGKTLSMLAVVVTSLGQALNSAIEETRAPTRSWSDHVPSKCTLVVVPTALLLESWMDEIEKHIIPGTILVHKYHGAGKAIALPELLKYDVVLTTYASIAIDFCRGQSKLHRVCWYRLVLDEAHWIRNPTTKQFRAIHGIPSNVRWCLTGTPIQNSLEDLGALVKFLRVPILEDLAIYRRTITVPVVANTSGRFSNLRRLLEALCLRRTKALLNLPEPETKTHVLKLSAAESARYNDFAELCKHAIESAVSGRSMMSASQHIIQAILGMRLFCNDGEEALARRKGVNGLPSNPEEALSFLQTSASATCALCDTEITAMYQEDDLASGRLTICQHLICGECIPVFERDLDNSVEVGRAQCPICGLHGDRASFIVKPGCANDSPPTKPSKYPTKLLALLENIKNQTAVDKCVIFSFWKTTLDIVARMFDDHERPYYRIHGQLSASKRSRVLVDFERSSHVQILLITFGTGAVGLNKLKIANHIHIIEPQWNPSVESQAIGRILRRGQDKPVKITRYIMKGTVEEAVQSRQLRKLQLAGGGFGLAKDKHTSQRVEEIMNLLCPEDTDRADTADVLMKK